MIPQPVYSGQSELNLKAALDFFLLIQDDGNGYANVCALIGLVISDNNGNAISIII